MPRVESRPGSRVGKLCDAMVEAREGRVLAAGDGAAEMDMERVRREKSGWSGGCDPPASAGAARSARHHRRIPRARHVTGHGHAP